MPTFRSSMYTVALLALSFGFGTASLAAPAVGPKTGAKVKPKAGSKVRPEAGPEPSRHVKPKVSRMRVAGVPPLLTLEEEERLWFAEPRKAFEKAAKAKRAHAGREAKFVERNPEAKIAADYLRAKGRSPGRHFSWRELGMTTPVKSQSPSGTCWAFSTVAAMEANWLRRHREVVDLSEQDLVNCNCRQCDGSAPPARDFEKIQAGLRRETANAYVGDGNSSSCTREVLQRCGACRISDSTPYRVQHWAPVNPEHAPGGSKKYVPVPVDEMKQALIEHGPLKVAMHIPHGSKIGSHDGTGVWEETLPLVYDDPATTTVNEQNLASHLVVITGWDDTKDAWEIKNSWGTGWGDHGYGWIKRGSNRLGMGASKYTMHAPDHHVTAVWRKGSAEEIQAHGWDYDDYRERYDELWPDGWRLHNLEVAVVDGSARYNAVWRKGAVPEIQVYGRTWADYQKKYDELWPKGWRIHILQPHVVNGQVRYTAVWRKSNAAEVQHYGLSYAAFKQKYDELWKQGWRVHLLAEYVVGSAVEIDAVWRRGETAEVQLFDQSYTAYRRKYDELWKQGWRLFLLENYVVNGRVRYTAVWRPSTAGEIQVYGWNYEAFRSKDADLRADGWRLAMLDVY